MITTRFRDVVWTGGICAAALAFYMVSQSVAAKRAELMGVERKIASTRQEIRRLRTEIDTRGGLAQIEAWNQNVYGLQAPGPEQFALDSVRLVALTRPQPLPLNPAIVATHGAVNKVSYERGEDSAIGAPVRTASAGREAAPMAVSQPTLRQANYVQAKPSALAPQAESPVREIVARRPARAQLDDSFLDGLSEDGPARTQKGRP